MSTHVPHPQASETSSGQTDEVTVEEGKRFAMYLAIDAVSGTNPTLDVTLQEKVNGEWYDRRAFDQKTDSDANSQFSEGSPGPLSGPVRFDYQLGGTNPDFDFELRLEEQD